MSYDNFRNGFWNSSTSDSGSQRKYSFHMTYEKSCYLFLKILFLYKKELIILLQSF